MQKLGIWLCSKFQFNLLEFCFLPFTVTFLLKIVWKAVFSLFSHVLLACKWLLHVSTHCHFGIMLTESFVNSSALVF